MSRNGSNPFARRVGTPAAAYIVAGSLVFALSPHAFAETRANTPSPAFRD